MAKETRNPPPVLQACTHRLVDFWDANPQDWLAYAESYFRRGGIKNELTKLDAVVEKLPWCIINQLRNLILKAPEKEPVYQTMRGTDQICLTVRQREEGAKRWRNNSNWAMVNHQSCINA